MYLIVPRRNPLVLQAQQIQALVPWRSPRRRYAGDARVAIGVALDVPLEAERDQGRGLDDELEGPHLHLPLRLHGRRRDREASQRGDPDNGALVRSHDFPLAFFGSERPEYGGDLADTNRTVPRSAAVHYR